TYAQSASATVRVMLDILLISLLLNTSSHEYQPFGAPILCDSARFARKYAPTRRSIRDELARMRQLQIAAKGDAARTRSHSVSFGQFGPPRQHTVSASPRVWIFQTPWYTSAINALGVMNRLPH